MPRKGVNVVQGNEATLTMQKSAEVIVPIRGRTESIGVLSMTEEGGNDAQPDNKVGNHTGIGDVPNKPVSQIWPEGWFAGTEHLYIQMPSLRVCYTWNKPVISEFALMNSEKSLVFIENSLKICYNPSYHAVA
jgi:hypothetical protein